MILLDIMMTPEMDGFQVLERLKANKSWWDIPVIIISAMSDMKSIIKGIKLGAEDYLPKPFDEVLLQARLEASLEKKRLHDMEHLYLRGLERELDIGRQIQAGFLPGELPQPPGWEIATYFHAAREVAGDFYDVFNLSAEEKIALVVGDVCGKGVGAALFMTLFRSLIRAMSNLDYATGHIDLSPTVLDTGQHLQTIARSAAKLKTVVIETNNYVVHTHGEANMFTTLFFGLLDPVTGSLIYINAGNELPIILGPTGMKARLDSSGPVVGVFPNVDFEIGEIHLEAGETLFIYTDGVPDARSPDGEFFKQERLLPLLAPPVPSATALLDRLETALHAHIANANQYDDITMLIVRRA